MAGEKYSLGTTTKSSTKGNPKKTTTKTQSRPKTTASKTNKKSTAMKRKTKKKIKKLHKVDDFRKENIIALSLVIIGMVTTLSVTTNALGFLGNIVKSVVLGQFGALGVIGAVVALALGAIRLVYSSRFSFKQISPMMIILLSFATAIIYGAFNLKLILNGNFNLDTLRIVFVESAASNSIGIWPYILTYSLGNFMGKTGMILTSLGIYSFVGIYYFRWTPSRLGDLSIVFAKSSKQAAKNIKNKTLDFIYDDVDEDGNTKKKNKKNGFISKPQPLDEPKTSETDFSYLDMYAKEKESKVVTNFNDFFEIGDPQELPKIIKPAENLSNKTSFDTIMYGGLVKDVQAALEAQNIEINEEANIIEEVRTIEEINDETELEEIKNEEQSKEVDELSLLAVGAVSSVIALGMNNKSQKSEEVLEETKADIKSETSSNNASVVDDRDKFVKDRLEKENPEELEIDIIKKDYLLPGMALLKDYVQKPKDRQKQIQNAHKLEETLGLFGIDAKVVNISVGPTITRYELQPKPGVKVSKVLNLSDDLALALAAVGSIRIEAPIPGTSLIGIELPNAETDMVSFKSVLESQEFIESKSKLTYVLGKDVSGKPMVGDISKMPHMLVAGSTGSGKSVCINGLICSILYKAKPEEVKFIMIDPKMVELSIYNDIPHLLIPVVTDMKKAPFALSWAVNEMNKRYRLFAENRVRDLDGYNKLEDIEEKLPRIVIIVDELADLMMVSPNEVEASICRLAQMARACGMHLVLATQRPSVDVITGLIKSNIPSRIAFAVSSQVDSRTILDSVGADKLIGKGDMLYSPQGASKAQRIQGAFITDKEVKNIVEFIINQSPKKQKNDKDIIEEAIKQSQVEKEEQPSDPLVEEVVEFAIQNGQISTSLVQRKFRIGYNRASRIIDEMEAKGICGPSDGAKPRKVYAKVEDEE